MNPYKSKFLFVIPCLLFFVLSTQSQTTEFEANPDGVLIPRIDRTTVANPSNSQLVWDINSESFWYYLNTDWVEIANTNSIASLIDQDEDTQVDVEASADIDEVSITLGGIENFVLKNRNGNAVIDIVNSTNTIIGGDAGLAIASGADGSTFIGKRAGQSNSTGIRNTFIGYEAARDLRSRGENVAIGYSALSKSTTAWRSVAIGAFALRENNDSYNVAVGRVAGWNSTEGSNTFIGDQAGFRLTTGDGNTFLGRNAGREILDGDYNISIGFDSGSTNGNNNISNSIAIGHNTRVSADNEVVIGNTSTMEIGGFQDWTNYSDARIKNNIKDNVVGLALINKLKPVSYKIDYHKLSALLNEDNGEIGEEDPLFKSRTFKSEQIDYGFLAQDVENSFKELDIEFQGLKAPRGHDDLYKLSYSSFVVPLVKAVQELDTKNAQLENECNDLRQTLTEVLERLSKLEQD